ncbi:MAG: response regulator [Syntrophales bacterium]|nr:response regulator [Syntrophales bacterium]
MMKVLIVDDEETMSDFIKEVIERECDCHVKMAANGEEGYVASLNFSPDIIITDIQMPVKNGLEMIREIRVRHPGIKTIYMSADPNRYRTLLEEEKLKYHVSVLQKPFSRLELFGAISEV